MSLFSVLNMANSGLNASQLGLDVTGENIANIDVEGYSRRRLSLTTEYTRDPEHGQIGFGVSVVGVERMRSERIDAQIRHQNHEWGVYSSMDMALESVENILNEPSDTGITNHVNLFFDSWENLANNPADLSARNMVKTNAEMLTSVFNSIAGELHTLKENQNAEIRGVVDEINAIAEEIFELNGEIAIVESSGNSANNSKDRRDLLLRDLSELTEFGVNFQGDGQATITMSGIILVSPTGVNKLEVYENSETRVSDDGYHQSGIRAVKGNIPIVPKSGKLHGLMLARDEYIPKYEKWIDELAQSIATTVNEQHQKGYNIHGFSGFDFFDPDMTGASDFALSTGILTNIDNIAAARGGAFIQAEPNVVTAGALNFGQAPVQLTKTVGGDSAINIAVDSVSVKIAGTDTVLEEGRDYSVDYVSGTIQMLHTGFDNQAMDINFQFATGGFPGPGNNENAILLSELRTALTMSTGSDGKPTVSFDQFYSSAIGELGLDRIEATSKMETREYLIGQYDTHQDSIAGVSLNEEIANLVKYQHTFDAAARIVSTVQQMLQTLLDM